MEIDPLNCKTELHPPHSIKNEVEYDSDSFIENMEIKHELLSDSIPFEEVFCKDEPKSPSGADPEVSNPSIETVFLETDVSELTKYIPEGEASVSNSGARKSAKKKDQAHCEKCSKPKYGCLCFVNCNVCGEPCTSESSLRRHVCLVLKEKIKSKSFDLNSANSDATISLEKFLESLSAVEVTDDDVDNKKTFCPYCSKEEVTFNLHLVRKHSDIASVKEMLHLPLEERLRFIKALGAYGNFILTTKTNVKSPVTGIDDSNLVKEYIECPECKGYMGRHSVHCRVGQKDKNGEGEYYLSTVQIDEVCSANSEFYEKLKIKKEVFPIMRDDKISRIAMGDTLICLYAEIFFSRRKDKKVKRVTSYRMREMGRLLQTLQNTINVKTLCDALKPQYFFDLIAATKAISGYNAITKTFKTHSLQRLMGSRLKHMCDIASKLDECKKSEEVLKDIRKLSELIDISWSSVLNLKQTGKVNVGGEKRKEMEKGLTLADNDIINKKRKHTDGGDTQEEVSHVTLVDKETEDSEEQDMVKTEEVASVTLPDKDIQAFSTINQEENTVQNTSASKESPSNHTNRRLCVYCKKTFLPSYLKKHIATVHHNIRSFNCQTCGKAFKQKAALQMHKYCHENYRPYVCAICSKTYTQQSHLNKHIYCEHSEHSAVCKICCKSFKNQAYLKYHMKGHTFRHECPVCKKTYSYKNKLKHHMKVKHSIQNVMKKDPLEEIQTSPLNEDSSDEETIIQSNETKLHSCPEEASVISTITATTITNNLVPMVKVEPGEFHSLQDEYNDLQMTNEDVNETVEGEEDTTDSKNGLLVPVLEVNESTENDADIWVTKQELTDQPEGKSTSDRVILVHKVPGVETPIMVNLRKGSTQCEFCKKTYANADSLKRHVVSVHMNLRPYQCRVCNKTFQEKSVLKMHEARHNDDRPFVCEVCKKSFICKSHLKVHLMTHVTEKTFVCKVCKKVFTTPLRLSKHMSVHDKRYNCLICEVTYAKRQSLLRHMDKKHYAD